tara:strand:- start:528 stop:1007 length:480 start_codon:yes stop_codon:yes gene_type:complete
MALLKINQKTPNCLLSPDKNILKPQTDKISIIQHDESQIPVVVVHIGYQDYVRVNLEITSKTNKIYLIGDDSMKHLDTIQNVTFVDIHKYQQHPSIVEAQTAFVKFSTNSKEFEWKSLMDTLFTIDRKKLDYNTDKNIDGNVLGTGPMFVFAMWKNILN